MKKLKKSEVQEIPCKKCRDLWPVSKCNEHIDNNDGIVTTESEMKIKLRQAWEKVLRESKKSS
jgi:hypothetical protein